VVVRDAGMSAAGGGPALHGTGDAGGTGGAGPARDAAAAEGGAASRPDAGRDAAAADRAPDAPVVPAPGPDELVIDEVLVNPAGDDLGREWIELASLADGPRDLSQLHLATATVDVAAPAGTLGPGALLVLGQSSDPAQNGGAPVDVAYGTLLLLVNADGRLSLCLGPCATGLVLDTVTWGSLPDADAGHALIVDPVTGASCAAEAPFGTGGGYGSPGAPNPPCAEIADGGSQADVSDAD
ncbi:MAG TPA: lamin tail domain-containing protein, partial [Polyangia bacterium]|nr:lamin tail domain-containing protein [Polyangia bacterium]